MNSLVAFIVLSFVTARLTLIITEEKGPWDVFLLIRQWAGVKYDEALNAFPQNKFAEGLVCAWCVSFWVGIVVALLAGQNPIMGLAYSYVTIIGMRVLYG